MKATLKTPIDAHGAKISELVFRAPRAGDFRGIKITLGEGGLSFETDAALNLAARLADIPPSSIDQLSFLDMIAVAGSVAPFLDGLEKALTPSSPTSSSAAASAQATQTD